MVRGDLRTYKIHLGSGNILMEPNDQYLCIVPAQRRGADRRRVFLPFEGDDDAGGDPEQGVPAGRRPHASPTRSITRQIKRG